MEMITMSTMPANFIKDFVPVGVGIRGPKKYRNLTVHGVCWHWTANMSKGANARAHRKYWERSAEGAHYAVDDKMIIHSAPDTEVVWHAGPSNNYTSYIKNKYPAGANLRLIGVELCVNSDGNWDDTYKNAVALGAYLCIYHNLSPFKNFERHYDCTKKDCPRMMTPYVTGGEAAWEKFKNDVQRRVDIMSNEPFADIKGHWAEKQIMALIKAGIVSGKDDKQFHPNEPITRAEMAAIIYNTLGYISTMVKL